MTENTCNEIVCVLPRSLAQLQVRFERAETHLQRVFCRRLRQFTQLQVRPVWQLKLYKVEGRDDRARGQDPTLYQVSVGLRGHLPYASVHSCVFDELSRCHSGISCSVSPPKGVWVFHAVFSRTAARLAHLPHPRVAAPVPCVTNSSKTIF